MRVVFVRHGEKRKGESDPELTSAGWRMCSETGLWLRERGVLPSRVLLTPTARTRQTAEALLDAFPAPRPPLEERAELPESREDWEVLVDPLARRLGPAACLLLVGHHPTLHFLADAYGPPPVQVPRHHFAAALVLEPGLGGWRCADAWPGRAG